MCFPIHHLRLDLWFYVDTPSTSSQTAATIADLRSSLLLLFLLLFLPCCFCFFFDKSPVYCLFPHITTGHCFPVNSSSSEQRTITTTRRRDLRLHATVTKTECSLSSLLCFHRQEPRKTGKKKGERQRRAIETQVKFSAAASRRREGYMDQIYRFSNSKIELGNPINTRVREGLSNQRGEKRRPWMLRRWMVGTKIGMMGQI